jgi:hypothetical protein
LVVSIFAILIILPTFAEEGSKEKKEENNVPETSKNEKSVEAGKEETPSGVGPGKAILEASKNEGIKLSEIALKTLEVITAPIKTTSSLKFPLTGLIFSQAEVGVYRLRSGWFKFIKVKVINRTATEATIQSFELSPGNQIVIQGGDLLRLADLNVWSGGEGGE